MSTSQLDRLEHAGEDGHGQRILLIGGHGAVLRACGKCGMRSASWRLRDGDGEDTELCVYCAALVQG